MSWTVYGDQFSTAAMTDTSQPLRFKSTENVALKAIRTWLIFYNSSAFSDLTIKLYADRGSSPAGLIASSITLKQPADLFTLSYAAVETWFEFSDVTLRKDTYYNLVVNCSGYTFSTSSLIAWMKAFPDPIYEDRTPTFEELQIAPYLFSVVSDEL